MLSTLGVQCNIFGLAKQQNNKALVANPPTLWVKRITDTIEMVRMERVAYRLQTTETGWN